MFKKIVEKKLTYAAGEKLRSYLPAPRFLSVTFAVSDAPLSVNRAIIYGISILNVFLGGNGNGDRQVAVMVLPHNGF